MQTDNLMLHLHSLFEVFGFVFVLKIDRIANRPAPTANTRSTQLRTPTLNLSVLEHTSYRFLGLLEMIQRYTDQFKEQACLLTHQILTP